MNRQTDERFQAHRPAKGFASSLIRHCSRAEFIAVALIALFVITTSMFSPVKTVNATTETITTVGADYTTPKASWNLGETSHMRVDGAPLPTGITPYLRRVIWEAPDGSVAQIHPLNTDPYTDDYSIPTTGGFAQVGTWTVKTIDNRGVGHAVATFTVLSATAANADLSITKSGPAQANAGDNVTYTLTITNNGPDAAQNVEIRDAVPANTTFVSESQIAGPAATCGNQVIDGITTSVCTISSLNANAVASFTLVYTVGASVQNGAMLFNGASVTSSTNEVNSRDNQASFATLISSAPPPPPCSINCPSDITRDNDANQCSAIVTFATPTASGNCADENGSVPPVVCSPPSGSAFPTGSTNVTCATGSSTCTFKVTVHDTRPPVQPTITCPANVNAIEDSPGSGEATVNYPPPSTTGNCVITTCDPPSGSTFNNGTTTVNCTATDSSNTVVSCSFTVSVSNGASCVITCPADVDQTAPVDQCSAVVTYSAATTSGNCGNVTCTPPSGSTFAVGVTTVTCTGDQGGSCDFAVTVIAPAPPVITTCASDRTISVDANCEAVIPNLVSGVVATGCSTTISQSPVAGTIVGFGAVTVTIIAENSAGQDICTANVTVQDTIPPTISCAGNMSTANDSNQCGAVVTYASPTASDNCSGVTTACSPAAGSVFPVGATTVTCTATDGAGNHTSCTFTVTVNDTQAPVITCPSNISTGTDQNSATATVTFQATVTDNCPGATVACTPSSGSQFALGSTTVSCTATDGANNHATCSFAVTVVDTQPPTITCPGNVTANNAAGACSATVTYANPTVTDNEPNPTFTCSPPSNSVFAVGVSTVTCTATDASGNHSSCSFTVTVRDVQAPVIACPANITVANASGQCSASVSVGAATATDNCGVTGIAGVRSDGLPLTAAYPVGTTSIVWTARDAAGNQASCTQTIVVNDTQAPVITGATASPSSLWPPNHRMVDVTINYGVTDNCTPSSAINCDLTVSSNEPPVPPGDGHNSSQWTVINAHHVQLRAEREGEGNGRIYTITITCKDSRNNTTTTSVTVTVPHNQ